MALGTERTSIPSLGDVVNRFPSIMQKLTDIDSQRRKQPHAFSDSEKIDVRKITTDLMWRKMLEMRNFTDERVFQIWQNFPRGCFPYRIWTQAQKEFFLGSVMSRQKKRNRLKKEWLKENKKERKNIEAVLVTKSWLRTKDTVCYKYVPTDNQIKLHNTENLYIDIPPPGQEVKFESEEKEDHWIWTAFFPPIFNVSEVKSWWWCKTLWFQMSSTAPRRKTTCEKRRKTWTKSGQETEINTAGLDCKV